MTTPKRSRDPALDLLRAAALARVVVWHALAFTWLTAISAIPVMFFVAGTLLGSSLGRDPYHRVLGRRAYRLLLPLWVYGAVVGAVGVAQAHADGVGLGLDVGGLLRGFSWVLPLTDPASSNWHDGWLSTHLWYLRAYLWVVALAPLLATCARRLGRALPVFVALIAGVELTRWLSVPVVGDGTPRLLIGDVVTYGLFATLGMAFGRTKWLPDRRMLALGAAICGLCAVAYWKTAGLPDGGVNASYVAVLLTGVGWLLAAGAAERPIRAIAHRDGVRRVTELISRRALTIYLWHPAAIIVALALVHGRSTAAEVVALGLALPFTAVAIAVAGFVESIAARRRVPRVHVRALTSTAVAPAVVAVLAVCMPFVAEPLVVPGAAGTAGAAAATVTIASVGRSSSFRPPSYRAALTNRSFTAAMADDPQPIRLENGRMPARQLHRALVRWRAAHPDVGAVAVSLVAAGKPWSGESHRRGARAIDPAVPYPTLSVTKLFTNALVLRAVGKGLIDLDAVAPRLQGVRYPRGTPMFTVRQLMQHTSGLVDYRNAPGFDRYPNASARLAVALALRAPRLAPAGRAVNYSSTNQLYLGLLLEDLTGRPYADLVAGLVRGLGLSGIAVGPPPQPGWIGHAASGVYATQPALARWAEELFSPGRALPSRLTRELSRLDGHNLGLGTWPLCPCWIDRHGHKRATAYGHHVGNGGVYHDPAGASFSIHIEPPTRHTGGDVESLQQLLTSVLRR